MFTVGVIAGLWAAFFQSLSYLATRHFVHERSGGTRMLLTLSHLWMGAVCFAALPFVWPAGGVPWASITLPLFGTAFFYVVGQLGLMLSLRKAQPSQVAPMLALKLLMLAGLTLLVKHIPILRLQWAAIAACIAGTFVLNYDKRERLPRSTFLLLLATCFFYSLSDWSIGYLTPAFGDMASWRAITLGSLLCYAACGLAAIPFVPFFGSRQWADWKGALPYSAAWLTAIFGLFASFALVGIIYGGILQSTRSVMGVALAALLTYAGHTHIEHMKSKGMFARRLAAALLMTLAVVLWALPRLAQ